MFYFYSFEVHNWAHSQTLPSLARIIPVDKSKDAIWCTNCMRWEKMKKDSAGNKYTGCGRQVLARTCQVGQPAVEWIEVRPDPQKLIVTLIIKYSIVTIPDAKQPNISFTQTYVFNMPVGTISHSGSRENVNLYFLPMDLTVKVQSIMTLFAKQLYGEELTNPLIKNDEKNSLKYLFAFVKNPFCPLFGYLEDSFFSEGCDTLFSRSNLKKYSQVCEQIGVKNYPAVQAAVEKKPELFPLLVFLSHIGFTEQEVFFKFFEYAQLIESAFGEARYIYSEKKIKFCNGRMFYVRGKKNYVADALAMWFEKAKMKHSQMEILNIMIQRIEEDPVIFVDGAIIFYQYFDLLPEEIKNKTIELCFSSDIHDEILDSIPPDQLPKTAMLRAKQPIEYSPRHSSWEDTVGEYVLYLPKNMAELKTLDRTLNTTFGRARESEVFAQKTVLLWLRKNEVSEDGTVIEKPVPQDPNDSTAHLKCDWIACIEIKKMAIDFVVGKNGSLPPQEIKEILAIWAKNHNLRFEYQW